MSIPEDGKRADLDWPLDFKDMRWVERFGQSGGKFRFELRRFPVAGTKRSPGRRADSHSHVENAITCGRRD